MFDVEMERNPMFTLQSPIRDAIPHDNFAPDMYFYAGQ